MYRIRQKFRGRKISPKASALYWDKNFAEFNFANSPRHRQEVVGGASVPPSVRRAVASSREKRLAAAPIPFSPSLLAFLNSLCGAIDSSIGLRDSDDSWQDRLGPAEEQLENKIVATSS